MPKILNEMLVPDLYPKTDDGDGLGGQEEGGGRPQDSPILDSAPDLEYQTYT